MIHFVLDALEEAGIHQKIVVVGYQAELVRHELATREDEITFVLQEEQLGIGTPCRSARKNCPKAAVDGRETEKATSPSISPISPTNYYTKNSAATFLVPLAAADPSVWAARHQVAAYQQASWSTKKDHRGSEERGTCYLPSRYFDLLSSLDHLKTMVTV